MHLLLLGSGGRESALAAKILGSETAKSSSFKLYIHPGNDAMLLNFPPNTPDKNFERITKISHNSHPPYSDKHISSIALWAKNNHIDLVISGSEAYLCAGLTDKMRQFGITVFGPDKYVAQLEGSKAFSKKIMKAANIPTADYDIATNKQSCLDLANNYFKKYKAVVLKCSGLAGGKGVFVCNSKLDIEIAIKNLYEKFSSSSAKVVVEKKLTGVECSYFVYINKDQVIELGFARDFKRLNDNDTGPNTGGMGVYSPVEDLPKNCQKTILKKVIHPLIAQLKKTDKFYRGILYVGLMYDKNHDMFNVLEFNVRLGDPECQVLAFSDNRPWLDIIMSLSELKHTKYLNDVDINHAGNSCNYQNKLTKTVAVVVSSSCYAQLPQNSKNNQQSKDQITTAKSFNNKPLSAELLRCKFTDEYQLIIFPSQCVIGLDPNDDLVKDLDKNQQYFIPKKGRLLTVVCKAHSYQQARSVAYNHIEKIKKTWSDIHYRTDIAKDI